MPDIAAPWHGLLCSSAHALKYAAIAARNSHARGVTEYAHAQHEALHTTFAGTAVRRDTRRPHQPHSAALSEVEFSYRGLVLSLSRVWYRHAYGYAWGVTHALDEIRSGRTPTTVLTPEHRAPMPHLKLHGAAREQREIARKAQQQVMKEAASFQACRWDAPASAWHAYAETVHRLLWATLLDQGAAVSQGGAS